MHLFKRLIVGYLFWRFVRWFERVQFFPPQRRTVKVTKPLPVVYETLPKLAGISAGEYFHGLRNRRPKNNGDLSEAAFAEWRRINLIYST